MISLLNSGERTDRNTVDRLNQIVITDCKTGPGFVLPCLISHREQRINWAWMIQAYALKVLYTKGELSSDQLLLTVEPSQVSVRCC